MSYLNNLDKLSKLITLEERNMFIALRVKMKNANNSTDKIDCLNELEKMLKIFRNKVQKSKQVSNYNKSHLKLVK